MMEFLHRSAEDRSIECEQGYYISLEGRKEEVIFYSESNFANFSSTYHLTKLRGSGRIVEKSDFRIEFF